MNKMKIRFSFLIVLSVIQSADVLFNSGWTPKPNRDPGSFLKRYQRLTSGPVDESAIDDQQSSTGSRDSRGDLLPSHLDICAFGRNLSLHFRRGDSVFTADAKIVVHGRTAAETLVLDAADLRSEYVEGVVVGVPRSSVRGLVHEGTFFGTVSAPRWTYYVQPAKHFFLNASLMDAIVYRDRDLKTRSSGPGWKSHGGTSSEDNAGGWKAPKRTKTSGVGAGLPEEPAKANADKRVCKMNAVADHLFFAEYAFSCLPLAVAYMEYYVRDADKMFRETDFDGDGRWHDVRIRMSRVEVYRTPHDQRYEMADERLQKDEYLEAFSRYDYGEHCAAVAFSHRDFAGGSMGVAHTGRRRRGTSYQRGICSPRVSVGKEVTSYNIGFVTFMQHGATQPVARCSIALAHVLGHIFGSTEDENFPDKACAPSQPTLKYIMHRSINAGTTEANRQFSPCSKAAMNRHMQEFGQCLQHRPECDGAARDPRGIRTPGIFAAWGVLLRAVLASGQL